MHIVCKELCFDAAHRLYKYNGKCARIHGHRYQVLVKIGYSDTDYLGIGVDFGDIKKSVGDWIDKHWDHKLVLCVDDPLYRVLNNSGEVRVGDMFIMGNNPTAENMAKFLAEVVIPQELPSIGRFLVSVTIYETPTSFAEHRVSKE